MKLRIFITILLTVATLFLSYTYNKAIGPIKGQIAVTQLEDSAAQYSLVRSIVEDDLLEKALFLIYALGMIGLWFGPTRKMLFPPEERDDRT